MKFIKEAIPYIIIIVSVVLIRTFIITPVRVDGESMLPSFENGEIVMLSKIPREYKRMEVVVFYHNDERLIKRVIGLPGEKVHIKDNVIYINGEAISDYDSNVLTDDYNLDITIPEGYYFLLGDNRYGSLDSRIIGLVSEEDIKGKIVFRIFPFNKIQKI